MTDNDKNIAKEILLAMLEKGLGELCPKTSVSNQTALTTDIIGKAYQNILKYVSTQDE